MSATTLRIIIALVFFVHGVGHVMGIMPALGISTVKGWSSRSWLLTPLLGESISRLISLTRNWNSPGTVPTAVSTMLAVAHRCHQR